MSKSRTRQSAARAARAPSARAESVAGANPSTWLVPCLIIAFSLPAIFLLPYRVPMVGPNDSQSWEFGFNNTTAQEFVALMLLALFAWKLFFSRADIRQSVVARVITGEEKCSSMRSLWMTMGSLQIINFAILILWYNILPYTHYGEVTYFMQRLEFMLEGMVPYRDFEFGYGAGMLAAPLFVYNLFLGRLSIEASYFSIVLLQFGLGYALLAYLVSRVNIQRGRALVFLLLAIPFINLTLGLQYTPLRFTIAPASIFVINQIQLSTRISPRVRWVLLGLAGLLLPFFNFLISPEMGLALTVALFAYFAWFLLGPERRCALLTISVVASIFLALLVFPKAYFDSMLSFGKGGASFPIFPTMHVIAFLAAAIWVFPQLGVMAVRDKTSVAPFSAGLAILMGLFILPTLGRCDAGHIFINSTALLLVSLSAATWLSARWTYSLFGIFALIFVVLIMAAFWDNYKMPMGQAIEARSGLSHVTYAPDNYPVSPSQGPVPRIHYSKLLPMPGWLKNLPEAKIGIPLGADEMTERFLHLTGRMIPEYHIQPYSGIYGPEELQRQYSDMRSMEYILIPKQFLGYLRPMNAEQRMRMQAEADCKFLSGLLLFPVDLPAVHPMFAANSDIMHRIADDYGVAAQFPDMLLLKRKNP